MPLGASVFNEAVADNTIALWVKDKPLSTSLPLFTLATARLAKSRLVYNGLSFILRCACYLHLV
jgi:hypothetical protein